MGQKRPRAEDTADERHHDEQRPQEAAEEELDSAALTSGDVCQSLLDRYGKSSAPHHRHLCASACAMRSLLSDEGHPLTPTSYLFAALTAIRDADVADREAVSALSSFLSVLLPLVTVGSLPRPKLQDAMVSTVIPILRSAAPGGPLPAPTVRSLVSALGFLVLGLDGDDWSTAEVPIEMLLKFAVDKRPKVRKSAQSFVEKSFLHFKATNLGKSYRKVIISIFKEYVSLSISEKPWNSNISKSEHVEMLQMLQIMKFVIPYLPKKTVVKLLPAFYDILPVTHFSQYVLPNLEVILDCAKLNDLVSESEKIISSLTSYISINRRIAGDIIISVSSLLRDTLHRIHPRKRSICLHSLPAIFSSLSVYLSPESDASQHVSEILKELISCHIDQNIFRTDSNMSLDSMSSCSAEVETVQSLCSLLEKNIYACCGVPNRHILAVVSDLFLKLGESSFQFMKSIILELGQRVPVAQESSDIEHLQECIGSGITAIGPEKMLHLFPISLVGEGMICSNTWLIPLLRKYVCGASLCFFMKNIAPLVMHLKKISKKGKKSFPVKDLQLCMHGLWDLLPAFCHYPIDTSQNFGSLSKLLVDVLVEDASLQKPIAVALQVLVKENKLALEEQKHGKNADGLPSVLSDDLGRFELRSISCGYSKEDATKNMEAIVSCSLDLFEALTSVFCKSPQENRLYLKGSIECLAPMVGSSFSQKFFSSLLGSFDLKDNKSESEVSTKGDPLSNGKKRKADMGKDERRNIMLELSSCFVVGACNDLVNIIYDYVKPLILDKDGGFNHGAYVVLCRILKEHSWFCAEKIDQLLNLLIGSKPSDANILRIHLSCLHFLLIYLLKNDEEENAFIILNEIILTLKDPDKEVREAAYDLLFGISDTFNDSIPGSPRDKLLTMIMGYLSSSSSQITSGAVAALSLLVYKDAGICLSVPSLLPSILALLRKKQTDVIKASLGFIKVLTSSLAVIELSKFVPAIVIGILPWSSVSKNHFRTKVKIIFEIMIRRCGATLISTAVPEKYRGFVRNIQDHRKKKKSLKEAGSIDAERVPPKDAPITRDRKRKFKHTSSHSDDKHSVRSPGIQEQKKRKKFIPSNARRQRQTADKDGKRELNRSTTSHKDTSQPLRNNFTNKSVRTVQKGRKDGRRAKNVIKGKRKQYRDAGRVQG